MVHRHDSRDGLAETSISNMDLTSWVYAAGRLWQYLEFLQYVYLSGGRLSAR